MNTNTSLRRMKTLILSLSFFILSPSLFSQSSPGYIVFKSGDTLTGYLFSEPYRQLAQGIGFSKVASSKPQLTYGPDDLAGFMLKDERFRSANITFEGPLKKNDNGVYVQPSSTRQTVFLSLGVEGNKSLYYFTDQDKREHFYFQDESGAFIELLEYKYVADKTNERELLDESGFIRANAHDKKYESQLLALFADCPKVESIIQETKLEKHQLIALFSMYNECVGQPLIYINPKGKTLKSGFFFSVGANSVKPFYSGGSNKYLTENNIQPNLGLTIGGNVEFYQSDFVKDRMIGVGLWIESIPVKGSYKDGFPGSIQNGDYTLYDFNATVLQLNLPVEYSILFPLGNLKGKWGGGVALSYSRNISNELSRQFYLNNEPRSEAEYREANIGYFSFGYGAFTKFGIQKGKWCLNSYLFYNSSIFPPTNSMSFRSVSMNVLFSYRLNK